MNSKEKMTGEIGGSYQYMPPEAFSPSYEPVRAFDIYRLTFKGILINGNTILLKTLTV